MELRAIVVNSKAVFGEQTVMPGFYSLDVGKNVRKDLVGETLGHLLVASGKITWDALHESLRRVKRGEGRKPYVYALDRRGAQALTSELGIDPGDIDWKPRSGENWRSVSSAKRRATASRSSPTGSRTAASPTSTAC